jgi:hypothetical protein
MNGRRIMRQCILFAVIFGMFLSTLASERVPIVFKVGDKQADVLAKGRGLFQGGQEMWRRDLYGPPGKIIIPDTKDVVIIRTFFLGNNRRIIFYFFNDKLVQMEVCYSLVDNPTVRPDYRDPKESTEYPYAYIFERIGNSAKVTKVYSDNELKSLLAKSA